MPVDDPGSSGIPDAVRKEFERREAQRRHEESLGYHLPHIEFEFQGRRVRGVGGAIYVRPLEETFEEFLIYLVIWTLGEDWFRAQRKLPAEERHFIMRCWEKYHEWKRRNTTDANRVGDKWGAAPDGWTLSLFALGVDIYSLLHRGELSQRMVKRLLHRDQYQGARYEIAIAGMFVRLGCMVKFLDGSGSKREGRHCEFIATHVRSGVQIAVEAKSRHRPGVLGRGGELTSAAEVRGDVEPLIMRALEQRERGMPFLVFVDVNAPMDVRVAEDPRPWVEDIERLVGGLDPGKPGASVAWNAVIVTNFAFHYATEREAEGSQFLAKVAEHAEVPLPSVEFLMELKKGLQHYGQIPPLS